MQIRDRVFVVTGAGNGMGREVVGALLAQGAMVAGVDRDAAGLQETQDLLPLGDRARMSAHTLDLTDRGAVEALPDAVLAAHGQVDGVLNLAGIVQPFEPILTLDPAVVERLMAVNYFGVVHVCQAFLPLLVLRPQAAILNVSSMGALVPVPGQSAYGASKAAVKLFTEGLIAEHQGSGVQVSVVFPGAVATDILQNSGVDPEHGAHGGADAAEPTRLTSPREAARQIVDGLAAGRPRIVIGRDARMIDLLSRLAPARTIRLIARRLRHLVEE